MMRQLSLLRQYSDQQYDDVFRRARVCRGSRTSRTSDTSSGGYSSSVYSTYSECSSTSDVSAAGFATDFDLAESTVIAADSDVEDGFVDAASVNPVSVASAVKIYYIFITSY